MNTEQFSRISLLIGEDNVNKLFTSSVLIVGLGGVGGMALEALVRAGVSNLTLVDFDTITVSNLNRQICATWDTVGHDKALEARKRALSINKDCNVDVVSSFFSEETADTIFSKHYDLVIDAIDSLNPKCCLLEYCYKHDIKVISSMGAALKRNPSLVRCEDLFDSYGDHLAKIVRKRMKSRGVGRGIKVVFAPEIARFDFNKPKAEEQEDILDRGRKRNVLGSLPTVTGIFGLTLAHHALSMLSDAEEFTGEKSINKR
ncbi:MAG: tRNA threonylcarbamoyladenosine dehydratase [Sphaerochaetaceae bacterium]|nr:tRNA threonylcarbamoyladenosine dehydratase [Sphaerochaetaceae bacterium]